MGNYSVGLWKLLALVTFPLLLMVQLLNVAFLAMACQELAVIENVRRKKN